MVVHVATGRDVIRIEDGVAEAALRDAGARCLATDGERIFAGGAEGVFRHADGRWEHTGFRGDVFSVAIGADSSIYAGCEPSAIFRSANGGESWHELESLREIPSRPRWSFPPRPWTSHVRWIAPSPHDPSLLLAGIELGGVMRSVDAGATWQDHRPGAQLDVHQLTWHPAVPGRAYEAGGGGAAWSRDAGDTWAPADAGRDRHYTWALAVDRADPDTWFISASTGPAAAHGRGDPRARIYRWRGEGPWEPLAAPTHAMPYALMATAEGTLLAGLADGGLFASGDGGDSWRPLELRGHPPDRILALA